MSEKSTKFVMTVKNQTQKPQTTHGKVHKTFTLNEGVPLPQIKVESGMDIYDDDDKNDIGHLEANQLDQVFEDRFGDDDNDIISTIRDHLPDSDCLMQHMDIREPLTRLKQLLEARFVVELAGYQFYLQGAQMLESHKTLVDQCVQGEGVVQINLQIQPQLKRINIIDVLKPADDYVEDYSLNMDDDAKSMKMPMKDKVVQWQLDVAFKKAQERLKIPSDPMDWNVVHVRHWVQWAVRQFNLPNIRLSDWSMNGEQLHKLTIADFQRIVPNDANDIFWTHFELLRQVKLVATIKDTPAGQPPITTTKLASNRTASSSQINVRLPASTTIESIPAESDPLEVEDNSMQMANDSINTANTTTGTMPVQSNSPSRVGKESTAVTSGRHTANGQVQLWQFLLELLTSPKHKHLISWEGIEGEFKLLKPEQVAVMWGERKNKPTMNYEKLSRALRYYYDGDMISKVQGKRFVYKFVCDLRQVLGYSALELARLIELNNPMRGVPATESFEDLRAIKTYSFNGVV